MEARRYRTSFAFALACSALLAVSACEWHSTITVRMPCRSILDVPPADTLPLCETIDSLAKRPR